MKFEADMDGMRLVSTLNKQEHWAKRKQRNDAQTYEIHLRHGKAIEAFGVPCIVTMTRVARVLMDDDNLRAAFKHIRDYLATELLPTATQANQHGRRGDDSDPRIVWQYGQRNGPYAVEITIERMKCPECGLGGPDDIEVSRRNGMTSFLCYGCDYHKIG